MKRVPISVAVAVVALLCVIAGVYLFWPRDSDFDILPNPITSIAEGHPIALRIKNRMNRGAHLTAVHLDLSRQAGEFRVQQICYGFDPPKLNGRACIVMLDNSRREAWGIAADPPSSPAWRQQVEADRTTPLSFSNITTKVPEVLEIARLNGLVEFGSIAPPNEGLQMDLFNSRGRSVWVVKGDAWDGNRPIAFFALTIDAQTKAVIDKHFDKAANR